MTSIVKVWTTALSMIGMMVVVYLTTYDAVCVQLYGTALAYAPPDTAGGYFVVCNLVRWVYNIFPWMVIFGILLWAYTSSQRQEYEREVI